MDTACLFVGVLEVKHHSFLLSTLAQTERYFLHTTWHRFQTPFRSPIPTLEVEKTTKELEAFALQCNDLILPESMPK